MGILKRCNNKNNKDYHNYGARGIKCLWEHYADFKRDMYESYLDHLKKFGKKNTSIDRIDIDGNYSKENCRWATIKEQAINKRKLLLTLGSEVYSVKEWAEKLGLTAPGVRYRLKIWSIEKALTEPKFRVL